MHVHVRLPAPGAVPAQLGRLKTNLPHFSQTLHDLTEAVSFEEVSLSGSHGPISAEVRTPTPSASRALLTGSMQKVRGTGRLIPGTVSETVPRQAQALGM